MNIYNFFFNTSKEPHEFRWSFVFVGIALIAGLLLSIVSALELCIEQCSANQDYRIFGLPFGLIGITFFIVLVVFHFLSHSYPVFANFVGWGIALAFGAELMFIVVQKTEIGHWCPVCLSIAASVALAGIILSIDYLKDLTFQTNTLNRSHYMEKLKYSVLTGLLIIVGFFSAFLGISKVDATQIAVEKIKDRLVFGNPSSEIEVYFFSDWYCPSCKKVEPLIEKMYPKIKSKVAFYFVDYAIHEKSLNYTPYHLAIEVNNKNNYFRAREVLMHVADKTDNPTDEIINKAMHEKGITIKELPFVDVNNGIKYFKELVRQFNLNATPTLVIRNKNTGKVITLDGADEITEKAVLDSIDKLSHS